MRDLYELIPDLNVLLSLEPEELGAKLLFLLKRQLQLNPNQGVHLGDRLSQINVGFADEHPGYPVTKFESIKLAVIEAWSWLRSQGLLIPAPNDASNVGWCVLSRRANRFTDERDVNLFATARHLPKEALHVSIAEIVWLAFMRGEFDVAVFQAMKAVEVQVRQVSGLTDRDIGTDLMRKAFNPMTGPLTDTNDHPAEKDAVSALFAGAIGLYKNPQSHRDVGVNNPQAAIEIILLANQLLRIVDERRLIRK